MRLYQIIMKVPDDFISDDMQLSAQYKDPVEIYHEGFIGDITLTESSDYFDPDVHYGEIEDLDEESVEEVVSDEGESDTIDAENNEDVENPSNSEDTEEVDDSVVE